MALQSIHHQLSVANKMSTNQVFDGKDILIKAYKISSEMSNLIQMKIVAGLLKTKHCQLLVNVSTKCTHRAAEKKFNFSFIHEL